MNTNTQDRCIKETAVKLALEMQSEELEKLLALSIGLVNHLEPRDPSDPDQHENLTAWRMAQVLNERLSSTVLQEGIYQMLLGKNHLKSVQAG